MRNICRLSPFNAVIDGVRVDEVLEDFRFWSTRQTADSTEIMPGTCFVTLGVTGEGTGFPQRKNCFKKQWLQISNFKGIKFMGNINVRIWDSDTFPSP